MTIPIYIVNFNTTELTNLCIRSIRKNLHAFDYKITVFDNSDNEQFALMHKWNANANNVFYIDNTNGQMLNFNVALNAYSNWNNWTPNNYGSFKHTLTIDYLFNLEPEHFILFDSDTILKHDIDFIDTTMCTIARIHRPKGYKCRFDPCIQYFNTKMLIDAKVHYFDCERIMFGKGLASLNYDTGTSFYDDVVRSKMPFKEIDHLKYVDHLASGSWANKPIEDFIEQNKCWL